MAGPHPDPDTYYETLHGSFDVNLQETANLKQYPDQQFDVPNEHKRWKMEATKTLTFFLNTVHLSAKLPVTCTT